MFGENEKYLYRIENISPIDGRYRKSCEELRSVFSEGGLTRFRLRVEIRYLKSLIEWLCTEKIVEFNADYNTPCFNDDEYEKDTLILRDDSSFKYELDAEIFLNNEDIKCVWEDLKHLDSNIFGEHHKIAEEIFIIEETTRHDVKSVEIYLRNRLKSLSERYPVANRLIEYVHFGLTSQDITTLAVWMQLRSGVKIIKDLLLEIENTLRTLFNDLEEYPLLSLTHGQPATPTSVGKELMVFAERIHDQLERLPKKVSIKFGGCIGNLNAHNIAYPKIGKRWLRFADSFVESMNTDNGIEFTRSKFTTQIDHYDDMAAIFDNIRRLNVVCLDLCRDMWSYISRRIFKLSIIEGEVGSSTMPHKVNPIDFENAEGNLILSNAIFDALSNKLPVSRLQRDLSDSTTIRNIGVPFSHSLIAYKSILKGLSKIEIDYEIIRGELSANAVVIAEAIQQILRTYEIEGAYDIVKDITRKNPPPRLFEIFEYIDDLDLPEEVKSRISALTPSMYTGIYPIDYKENK